jgi:hypothetical protein
MGRSRFVGKACLSSTWGIETSVLRFRQARYYLLALRVDRCITQRQFTERLADRMVLD